ncbi:hypothetical protein [Nocardia sp. NPDC060249]|uniref:hypothetical protein n=1 Tax=Nocardia sp. NPDC060249 TaxID=3347082 RepID=UPI00366696BE
MGVVVLGVPGCGVVPGTDGVEAVGLLVVCAWSPVVGVWVEAGLDGFVWAVGESVVGADGVAGVSTGGRSSEDEGAAVGLGWAVGPEVSPGAVGVVLLGVPFGFGFVVPFSLGDEGALLSAGVEGLVDAGSLGEFGDPVPEGFPLSAGDVEPGEVSPGELGLGELSPGELGLGELSLGELGLGELSPGELGLGEPSPDGVSGPPGLSVDGELSPGEEGEPAPDGWVAPSPSGLEGAPSDAGVVEPGVSVDAGEADCGALLFGRSDGDDSGSPVPAGLVGAPPVSPNSGTVGAEELPLPCRLDSSPLCTPPAPALVNVSTPISSLNSWSISKDAALADATCADRSAPSSVAAPAADLAANLPRPEVTLSPTPPSLSPRPPPTAPPTAPPKVAKPRSAQPNSSIDRSPLATWMVRASASIPPSSNASNAAPRIAARAAALAIPRAIMRVISCFTAIFTATCAATRAATPAAAPIPVQAVAIAAPISTAATIIVPMITSLVCSISLAPSSSSSACFSHHVRIAVKAASSPARSLSR